MLTKGLMCCLMLLAAMSAHALPPEVEADRLALRARSALDAKDYPLAIASLTEMEKLGVPLPQSFYYLKGIAQNGNGKHYAAKESLEKYLKIAGSSGKFYKEALDAYNRAEQGGQRVMAEYKDAQARYEREKESRQERINSCFQSAKRRYSQWEQDYSMAKRRQVSCSSGCFINCDRCRPLWDDLERIGSQQPEEPSEYDCQKRFREPSPPVEPVLY